MRFLPTSSVAVFFYGKINYSINYPGRLRGIFELKTKTIEDLGIPVVNISSQIFNELPEHEKFKYIEREILYKLK